MELLKKNQIEIKIELYISVAKKERKKWPEDSKAAKLAGSLRELYGDISVHVALSKLFLNGVFPSLAVRHVEAEVGPLVCSGCVAAVGDGDGVAHTKVHCLHDTLPLQFTSRPDCHGGHVTAGANELLAVIMALLHVLEASPDGQTELLWDLKSSKILRGTQRS